MLREKRVSWEIKGQGNARKYFAKKTVAFDAINMTCAGGRVPVDDCGVGADDRAHRDLRNRVRAAAFPRGILDAEDAPAAYEWANRQFGGDLLPPKGHADYNKTLAKFQYVRRLYR